MVCSSSGKDVVLCFLDGHFNRKSTKIFVSNFVFPMILGILDFREYSRIEVIQ